MGDFLIFNESNYGEAKPLANETSTIVGVIVSFLVGIGPNCLRRNELIVDIESDSVLDMCRCQVLHTAGTSPRCWVG